MRRALAVTWSALRAVQANLVSLCGMGLTWFVMSLLLPYAAYWLAGALALPRVLSAALVLASLVPMPPATAALYLVAYHAVRQEPTGFLLLWRGFRAYLGRSWKVTGLLLLSGAVLAFDVLFYLRSEHAVFLVIGLLGMSALVFWLAIQVYLFPLMILQEDGSLKGMLKNASLLTLAYPFFALGILVVTLLATAVSVLLLIVLVPTLWMPFVAVLNSQALVSSLQEVERHRQGQIGPGSEDREDG